MKKSYLFKWKGLLFTCMWIVSFAMIAQDITVSGTVIDTDDVPVIGATVVLQDDPSRGTVTDIDGNYTISTPRMDTSNSASWECKHKPSPWTVALS